MVEIFAFGNLAFLALDIYLAHRVNDFAHPAEWIPIYFSATVPLLLIPGIIRRRHNDRLSRKAGFAVGVSSILVAVVRQLDRQLHRACVFVMGLHILVGVLGFALHATADIHGPADSVRDNFIYGAPVFAPLLFWNLAILAIIGLWEMLALEKSGSTV